ncbi:MAG: DUF6686 family protein [Bacteroidota bacterium]
MQEHNINQLYSNTIGMTFQWKRSNLTNYKKINLIFNNTGLHLTTKELEEFLCYVQKALAASSWCKEYDGKDSKSILLETPFQQLSFAMSYKDLESMKDLIKGTLFQLGLDKFIKDTL